MLFNKKEDNDIVIIAAYRTPFGKAGKGSFKNTTIDYLLYSAITGSLKKANILPELIEEVVFGNVLCKSGGTIETRMACLRSGIPISTPIMIINRQCGSSLEAIYNITQKIKEDRIEIGMAGGFEFMSKNFMTDSFEISEVVKENENAKDCMINMGLISEKLTGITREEADIYANESQYRALSSKDKILNEIIPIEINGNLVIEDDGIRETNVNKLNKLKPVFKENGILTAGNSSQLSDGVSIVILMKRSKAIKLGLNIMGVFIDYSVVGIEPSKMGLGPVLAISKLLKRNNLNIKNISVFEINEAFASQVLCCIKKLNLNPKDVNKYGGAIALGHPLGASGGRLVVTILNIMNSKDMGIVSLCIGSGMGIAALILKE